MRPGRLALCELAVLLWVLVLCAHGFGAPLAAGESANGRNATNATDEAKLAAWSSRPSPAASGVSAAIRAVFGPFAGEALRVSWCESRWLTSARNGRYWGLFQMGAWERRRYGHGSSALAQARAAHRYFVASGRDWSPWSCKP